MAASSKRAAARRANPTDRREGQPEPGKQSRPSSVRQAIRTELAVDAKDDHEREAAEPRKPRAPNVNVVELDHVSLSFDRPILEDVSFAARSGETVCIVGESGTGKSTALKLILQIGRASCRE